MSIHVFLDESGDLGWKFDSPHRKGGSSRFLTLAFLITSEIDQKYPKRLIRNFRSYYRMKTSREIKGSDLTDNQIMHFAQKTFQMLDTRQSIFIRTITVKKPNVEEHIRSDSNKLYNYMINLCLLNSIENENLVYFTPDPRTIKVSSGDSMVDYLQTQLWFDRGAKTSLVERPFESHSHLNLQFIDVVSHIVWRHFEDKFSSCFDVLKSKISVQKLFF